MLVFVDDVRSVHPRIGELVPRLRGWKREFRGSEVRTIGNASERLVGQIEGSMGEMIAGVRDMLQESLVCGVRSCRVRGGGLTVCKACGVQRYCGREHQKQDWKFHKLICGKGLVEPEAEPEEG